MANATQMLSDLAQTNVIIPLTQDCRIHIQGPDASTFLQGQLSCDINSVGVDNSALGAYCNQKGRVLALFRLLQQDNGYTLLLPKMIGNATITTLKKYAIFSKVDITLDNSDCFHIGLCGHDAANLLSKYNLPVPVAINATTHVDTLCIIKVASTQYELLSPESTCPAPLKALLNSMDQGDETLWQVHKILHGIPTITQKTVGDFLPHFLNLITLGYVSFNKGCFMGQEIIARMHYRGHIKKHLYLACSQDTQPPTPGTAIVDDGKTQVGTVVSSEPLSERECVLLAVIPDVHQNKPLFLASGDGASPLSFVNLP